MTFLFLKLLNCNTSEQQGNVFLTHIHAQHRQGYETVILSSVQKYFNFCLCVIKPPHPFLSSDGTRAR